MSEIPARLFQLAKGYLDSARDRIDALDSRAVTELSRSLNFDDVLAYRSASDDPMERARIKITAARQLANAPAPLTEPTQSTLPSPSPIDPLATAYSMIGVPFGSDLNAVTASVNSLRERCALSRFPDGSVEQVDAKRILTHIDEAATILRAALAPAASRFENSNCEVCCLMRS